MKKSAGKQQPPQLAIWLFKVFFGDNGYTRLGDLEEVFFYQVESLGYQRARFWFWKECLVALPHKFGDCLMRRFQLLRHEFKMVGRRFRKDKMYAVINVAGLTIGLTCALTISLFVYHDKSFDRFHKNRHLIYRLCSNEEMFGKPIQSVLADYESIGPILESIAGIRSIVRLNQHFGLSVASDREKISVNPLYVSKNFFKVFDFELLEGQKDQVLREPHSVVITPELSIKLFGDKKPIGKSVILEGQRPLTVTGLMKSMPQNSHIQSEFVVSFEEAGPLFIRHCRVYLLFHKAPSLSVFANQLNQTLAKRSGIIETAAYVLQPLTEIHNAPFQYLDLARKTSPQVGRILSLLAIIIMLFSCINYTNLSMARAMLLIKEVALTRILGARRYQVFRQFLMSGFLFALLSMGIAYGLMRLLLPYIEKWSLWQFGDHLHQSWTVYGIFIGIGLITGLMAGLYPAIYVSAFKPLSLMKYKAATRSRSTLRNLLTAVQVCLTVLLLFLAGVMTWQLRFMMNFDFGADMTNLVQISIYRDSGIYTRKTQFRDQLKNVTGIDDVILSTYIPGSAAHVNEKLVEDCEAVHNKARMPVVDIDYGFIDFFKLHIVAGRNFSEYYSSDETEAVIVNESAVRAFGWDDPIGKRVKVPMLQADCKVVGVVEDFHIQTLRYDLRPTIFKCGGHLIGVTVRYHDYARDKAFRGIQSVWDQFATEKALSQNLEFWHPFSNYLDETKMLMVLRSSIILSLVLAFLGMLGVSAFSAKQRSREVSIRKVLGAGRGQIAVLLSRQYFFLTIGASFAAWPGGYFYSRNWLQQFAYQPNYPFWIFPLVTAIMLIFVLVVVNIHIGRTAARNPAEILKCQ